MSQNQNKTSSKNRAARKKKIAVWNRRLAWATLPLLLVSTFAVYAAKYDWISHLKMFGAITSLIFILLLLTHSAFSVYLFGFPKLRKNIRVAHIYIGYAIFVFTLISQSIIGFEPYHNISYALNWIFIAAHVALSTRFMVKRNFKKTPEPELQFYTSGSLFRDAIEEKNSK